MKIRRTSRILIEPPAAATGDIAFNLIIFFLICASVQPEKGIRLQVPSSETVKDKQQGKNVEIILTSSDVTVNGDIVPMENLKTAIEQALAGKTNDNDRVVILKTPDGNTPGQRWASVVATVKQAKGIITLQIEEERIEVVN